MPLDALHEKLGVDKGTVWDNDHLAVHGHRDYKVVVHPKDTDGVAFVHVRACPVSRLGIVTCGVRTQSTRPQQLEPLARDGEIDSTRL